MVSYKALNTIVLLEREAVISLLCVSLLIIVRFFRFYKIAKKQLHNPLIMNMLQKHSFYRVITMLLHCNNYAFTTQ